MKKTLAISKLLILEIFRKKDFYVAFVLTGFILFYAARLHFYNASNAYRYLLDMGLFLSVFFASFLTVSLAARQFPSETQAKTCHVLLSKPVSRNQFVLGKFLGSFSAGLTVLFLFFAVLMGAAVSKATDFSWVLSLQTFYLFGLSLMILTAMTIFFSFFMTTTSNISISLALFLVIHLYGARLRHSAEAIQEPLRQVILGVNQAIPHFGFFDMRQRFIHGWEPISFRLILFLTAYAFCYSAFFLFAGCAIFQKKNIP